MIHHVIGWSTLTIPLITLDYFTTTSVAFLFIEISGTFPCIRYLMFQHGFTNSHLLMTVNSLLLAITFVLGRMPALLYITIASVAGEVFKIFKN